METYLVVNEVHHRTHNALPVSLSRHTDPLDFPSGVFFDIKQNSLYKEKDRTRQDCLVLCKTHKTGLSRQIEPHMTYYYVDNNIINHKNGAPRG